VSGWSPFSRAPRDEASSRIEIQRSASLRFALTAGSTRSSVRLGRAVNFYKYPIRADGELAQSPSQVAPTDGWTTADIDRLLPGS
jgi:hypothetical protein